ncbi:MAG: M20/M25/M40 family metallo-hydrolase [Ignavibacteriales bacterium]|nr:M20/M25/M40 family metallo-hydrolase [Ignavibacteriales bacterium]
MRKIYSVALLAISLLSAQPSHQEIADKITRKGLEDLYAFEMLEDLTQYGHRFSGTPGYDKAVQWAEQKLKEVGADSVWLQPVVVPHWVRGNPEKAVATIGKKKIDLSVCALGGSVATPKNGITAEVIEVKSLAEAKQLGERAKGKIIFYNRPFDKTKINPFEAYGGAVDQRSRGAIEAAKVGAVAVLVRSMTNAIYKVPHTGAMRYADTVAKIPAAAISTMDANYLSDELQKGSKVSVTLTMDCTTLPEVQTYSVIGEIRGTEYPNEIVLIGGHLDSWDRGTGAHDDGSGVVQCIDVLRLMHELQLKPKRTIRCVLFANEENGLRGARAYAKNIDTMKEKHIVAIESDAGGFSPRGFGVEADSVRFLKIASFASLLENIGADRIRMGGGGADISVLEKFGTVLIGLSPDPQRYFDYHHTDIDTIDKVHPRELQLGAIAIAILTWALAQEGV